MDDTEELMKYAREIFLRFLPRAWRRPVAEEEVEPILRVVQTELDNGQSFHEDFSIWPIDLRINGTVMACSICS